MVFPFPRLKFSLNIYINVEVNMTLKTMFVAVMITLSIAFSAQADSSHADIMDLVKESNAFLNENGKKALRQMNKDINKKWKKGNSYIFVVDCSGGRTLIHVKKAVIGVNLLNKLKDKKTGRYFLKDMCQKSQQNPEGIWHTYWWAKPKETRPSRKLSFVMRSERFPNYMIGSGIYSENLNMGSLNARLRVK